MFTQTSTMHNHPEIESSQIIDSSHTFLYKICEAHSMINKLNKHSTLEQTGYEW